MASAAARIDRSIVCETPSISFSAMLPVSPSVTTTSAAPLGTSPPSTLPRKSKGSPPSGAATVGAIPAKQLAQLRRGLHQQRSAARLLLAVGEQRDARPRDPEQHVRERGAHERELHQVLGARLRVRADVEQRDGMPARAPIRPRRGSGDRQRQRQRGPVDALARA